MINSKRPSDWALYLHEKYGFIVFPLAANTKVPPKGLKWQEWGKTCTSEKITKYSIANPANNWAIDCEASNLVVIDVDNKGDKKGSEELKKLELLPPTLTIETPSGGFHYFFRGQAKSTASKIAEGIDTRGKGGYVVAAGSKIDNKRYEIIKDQPIPELPAFYKSKLFEKEAPIVLNDDVVIQEGNRTNTILSLAGSMRRRGFSRDAIFAAINIENEKLEPPLSEAEINRIADSVAKYSPEIIDAGIDFEALESENKPKTLKDFTGIPPKRSWLIEDWIPANEISSLYGSGGTGKSLLSLQLAFSVATGMPFLNTEISLKMPVLAIFCEDTDDELHRRIHAIKNAPEMEFLDELTDADIRLWARVGLNNDIARVSKDNNDVIQGSFRPALEEQLLSMPKGPKFVILDTLSDIYLGDENTREKVNKFVKTHIGSLVTKYQLTVLILAHPSRSGQNTKDMLSGSTAWENAVRNRLAFVAHDTVPDIMILRRMKSNYAKRGEEIYVKWEHGRFVLIEAEQQKTASFILDVMSVGSKLTTNDMSLADFTDVALTKAENAFLFKGLTKSTFAARVRKDFKITQTNNFYEFIVKGSRFIRNPISDSLREALC